MSAIDLIILGTVKINPCSAYDIQKKMEYQRLSSWVRISTPSVYKKVLRLSEDGYLSKKASKEGKMPEKIIYSITQKGEDYFTELMDEIAAEPLAILFDFNAVIANLNKVPLEQALQYLDKIKQNIGITRDFMATILPKRQEVTIVGKSILEQQISVADTLSIWINEFEKDLKKIYRNSLNN